MKHQQVSVDYWAMVKTMVVYGALTGLVWIMLRLFNTVFTLPGRLRAQQENMQNSLAELQWRKTTVHTSITLRRPTKNSPPFIPLSKRRYPDLNITEEDMQQAEKELEYLVSGEKPIDDDDEDSEESANKRGVLAQGTEHKKTI